MAIYGDKFFTDILKDMAYDFAKVILPQLRNTYNVQSIADVGCGNGGFIACAKEHFEINKVVGIDGEYAKKHFRCGEDNFYAADLSKPVKLEDKYDLVVSLEVAEHLPESSADTFVTTLTSLGNMLLFSAANVGQPGIHHVNNQPPEYWMKKFETKGYKCLDIIRPFIKDMKDINRWYRANAYLYIKG